MVGKGIWRAAHPKLWKGIKRTALAVGAAQIAAVVAVHAVDRVRVARIPGGVHGFPALPPDDVQVDDDNVVRIYTEGHTLYDDMIDAIDTATDYVYFDTYIIRADSVGQQFKDALYRAAKRGVDVHFIYDGFGVLNQDPRFKIFPKQENLHVRRIPTVRSGLMTFNLRNTGRDHRKILVADGKVAFCGGYNIGERFANEWRDTHIRITGPTVAELDASFARFWNHFRLPTQPKIPDKGPVPWSNTIDTAINVPYRMMYPIRGIYVDAMERATKSIKITTAYFIPDREIMNGLLTAARRGVDVEVLIPEYSNHILADWVARPYYGKLLENGVKIWLYQHSMIHSKTMTVDGVWSTVGTANIDRLSLQGNYEVNVQITSDAFAKQMEKIYDNDLTTARQLTMEEWSRRDVLTRVTEVLLSPFVVVV